MRWFTRRAQSAEVAETSKSTATGLPSEEATPFSDAVASPCESCAEQSAPDIGPLPAPSSLTEDPSSLVGSSVGEKASALSEPVLRRGEKQEPNLAFASNSGIEPSSAPAPKEGNRLSAELVETARTIHDLARRQEELNSLFESRLQADEVQGRALERLHDQLQAYKTNFIHQALLPLLKEVMFCFDYVASALEPPTQDSSPDADALAKSMGYVKSMLQDILFKYDFEPYRSEVEHFDRMTQQCIKTIPTDIQADNRKIASVGTIGFRNRDTVLRKEQVTVYKYTPADV
jgi:molecular chaperone GrpE (heat shock protein)